MDVGLLCVGIRCFSSFTLSSSCSAAFTYSPVNMYHAEDFSLNCQCLKKVAVNMFRHLCFRPEAGFPPSCR